MWSVENEYGKESSIVISRIKYAERQHFLFVQITEELYSCEVGSLDPEKTIATEKM